MLATSCSFTNGADSEVVAELYRKTATALLSSTTELKFEKLEWTATDYQRLGEALPYCTSLETLSLHKMSFDAAGSAAVQSWVLPPSVKYFDLFGCWSLVSLPDASSLKNLEVYCLPEHLEPWRAGGFKAWELEAQQTGA